MVWNLFLSKVVLVWGKARSHRAPNLDCRGAESPGWFDVLPKSSAQDLIHEQVCCHDEAASHQLPITAAFWIIWIVSTQKHLNLTQNLVQIYCSTCSDILNAMATQHTCSLSGAHWLVQWCRHYSHICIPVHSPWLPVYIHVRQTIFVMLIMAGLFLDRPLIYVSICVCVCMYKHIEWLHLSLNTLNCNNL